MSAQFIDYDWSHRSVDNNNNILMTSMRSIPDVIVRTNEVELAINPLEMKYGEIQEIQNTYQKPTYKFSISSYKQNRTLKRNSSQQNLSQISQEDSFSRVYKPTSIQNICLYENTFLQESNQNIDPTLETYNILYNKKFVQENKYFNIDSGKTFKDLKNFNNINLLNTQKNIKKTNEVDKENLGQDKKQINFEKINFFDVGDKENNNLLNKNGFFTEKKVLEKTIKFENKKTEEKDESICEEEEKELDSEEDEKEVVSISEKEGKELVSEVKENTNDGNQNENPNREIYLEFIEYLKKNTDEDRNLYLKQIKEMSKEQGLLYIIYILEQDKKGNVSISMMDQENEETEEAEVIEKIDDISETTEKILENNSQTKKTISDDNTKQEDYEFLKMEKEVFELEMKNLLSKKQANKGKSFSEESKLNYKENQKDEIMAFKDEETNENDFPVNIERIETLTEVITKFNYDGSTNVSTKEEVKRNINGVKTSIKSFENFPKISLENGKKRIKLADFESF